MSGMRGYEQKVPLIREQLEFARRWKGGRGKGILRTLYSRIAYKKREIYLPTIAFPTKEGGRKGGEKKKGNSENYSNNRWSSIIPGEEEKSKSPFILTILASREEKRRRGKGGEQPSLHAR